MTSASSRTASYTLIIIKRTAARGAEAEALAALLDGEARLTDRHYIFATTMADAWIGGDPLYIAEFYRKCWGMENSYKSYEAMRPRTTSTDYPQHLEYERCKSGGHGCFFKQSDQDGQPLGAGKIQGIVCGLVDYLIHGNVWKLSEQESGSGLQPALLMTGIMQHPASRAGPPTL